MKVRACVLFHRLMSDSPTSAEPRPRVVVVRTVTSVLPSGRSGCHAIIYSRPCYFFATTKARLISTGPQTRAELDPKCFLAVELSSNESGYNQSRSRGTADSVIEADTHHMNGRTLFRCNPDSDSRRVHPNTKPLET